MHIPEERTVCTKQSLFDTSAEEGGVKVWEPNDCRPVSYSDQFLPGVPGD